MALLGSPNPGDPGGPRGNCSAWEDTQTPQFQWSGVGKKEGWRLQDPDVLWERAAEAAGRWGISGGP